MSTESITVNPKVTVKSKSSHNIVLPWQVPSLAVVYLVFFQVNSDAFTLLGHLWSCNLVHLVHGVASPGSGSDVALCVFLVQIQIMEPWVPLMHYVVQNDATLCDLPCIPGSELHCRQEAPPPVSCDAECFFYNVPCSGHPVVEYALTVGQYLSPIRLHHPPPQWERIVPNKEKRQLIVIPCQRFQDGKSHKAPLRSTLTCPWLKMPTSDAVPHLLFASTMASSMIK